MRLLAPRSQNAVLCLVLAALLSPAVALARGGKHPEKSAPAAAVFRGTRAFCDAFEQIASPRLARCTEADREAPGVAAALDGRKRAHHQCLEVLNSALDAKRLKIDAAAADRCAIAHRAYAQDPKRPRDKLLYMRTVCDAAFIGLRGPGEACESPLECAEGLACVGLEGAPPGTCQQPLKLGRACVLDAINASGVAVLLADLRPVCGSGSHCASSSLDSRCAKDLGEKAKCSGQDAFECGVGLRCAGGACVLSTLGESGAACAREGDCAAGFSCAKNLCTLAAAAGAACKSDDECRGACAGGKCISRCGSG